MKLIYFYGKEIFISYYEILSVVFPIIQIIVGFYESACYMIFNHTFIWENQVITSNGLNLTILFIIITVFFYFLKGSEDIDLFDSISVQIFSWGLGVITEIILAIMVEGFNLMLFLMYSYLTHLYELLLYII